MGWGGFWFWDPVENASLLPWFAMTALFHSLIVFEKRNLFYFWVIILCLITFTFGEVECESAIPNRSKSEKPG